MNFQMRTTELRIAAPASSKTYIIRSVLDAQLIKLANTPDPDILEQETKDGMPQALQTGAILSWDNTEPVEGHGILVVLLSLILVHGKSMPDSELPPMLLCPGLTRSQDTLRAQMKKLKLNSSTTVSTGTAAAPKEISLDTHLGNLMKQGYLERIKVGGAGGGAAGKGKRMRGAGLKGGNDDDGDVEYEWRWGERAQSEISEEGARDFMVDFLMERAARQQAQDGNVQRQDALDRTRQHMGRDIGRAAASDLTSI